MRIIKKCLVFVACVISIFSYSQKRQIKELSVGDAMPDFTFRNIWNYKAKTARISDFKGKLIILDFWSTHCTSCIEAFTKMSSLQKQFGNKIQILLVNPHSPKWESIDNLKRIIRQYKVRTGDSLNLPMPMYDTLLTHYFPFLSEPHEVWINTNNKVIAITRAEYVNEENIQAFLDGKELRLPIKNDWFTFDKNVPLLVNSNGGDDGNFIYRSLFTKYNSSVPIVRGNRINDKNELTGYYAYNFPLKSFINTAYSDLMNNGALSENRKVYRVQNIEEFTNISDTSYQYCYELTIGNGIKNQDMIFDAGLYLKRDLTSAFNINVTKQKQKMNCYVVSKIDPERLRTKYEKEEPELRENSVKKYFHYYSLDRALYMLDHYCDKPLVNETGMSDQKIDIDFPDNFDLTNQQAVINFLKSIGFEIKGEERELDVVVITDK